MLLSFGGSDPQGLTLLAARALMPLPAEVELLAVTGPAFAFHRELDETLQLARRAGCASSARPAGTSRS